MVETIPTNTEVQVPVATGNPFDLVGAQAPVAVPVVNQTLPVVAIDAPVVAPKVIPAAKPGSTFLDQIMRTLAKVMGHPDPFTGQPAPKETASQVAPQTTTATKSQGFMGNLLSNFNLKDLAATTKLLADQAMKTAKQAGGEIKQAATINISPVVPTAQPVAQTEVTPEVKAEIPVTAPVIPVTTPQQ